MPVKDVQLNLLHNDIKTEIPNYWVFPTENGIQGFMGTGGQNQIMFVGERPSSIKHGIDSHRIQFYKVLKRFNLHDAHITDIIKSRGTVNEPYPDLKSDWRFFKRELTIVEPKLVFTLSEKVHQLLMLTLIERGITEVPIYHYSYAFRYNKIKEFNKQLEQGLKLL